MNDKSYAALGLSAHALSLIDTEQKSSANIETLLAADCPHDAVVLLAHGLPKREAAWWACGCAAATLADDAPSEQQAAIAVARQWARQPTEQSRQEAARLGEALGTECAAGLVALAAAWSTGSIADDSEQPVPPPPGLSAATVAGAVSLAAAAQPTLMIQSYRQFISEGLKMLGSST